jgi:hypothetical protein
MNTQHPNFAYSPDNTSTELQDTTPRDRAIYVPSITPGYAMDVYDMCGPNPPPWFRALPKGVSAPDLNFLDPQNQMFRLSHALWSAGQAVDQKRRCIVNQRDRSATKIIGDSGGYQIANSGLVISTDKERLKILRWLEANTDYAMTLDVPPGKAGKPGYYYKSFNDCLVATIDHLNFFRANRQENGTQFLNVLQGNTKEKTDDWYEAVKGYNFEGWAFAGPLRKNFYLLCRRIIQMFEEDQIQSKTWIHVLGTGEIAVGLLLTVLQRAINKHMNPNLRISYDTSTPFSQIQHSQVYSMPNFTREKMVVSAEKIPDRVDLIGSHVRWPWPSPVGDKLRMADVCVGTGVHVNSFRDSQSNYYLINHSLSVLCGSIDVAHRIFDVERVTGAKTLPRHILAAADAIDEVIETRSLYRLENLKSVLTRATGKVSTEEERL